MIGCSSISIGFYCQNNVTFFLNKNMLLMCCYCVQSIKNGICLQVCVLVEKQTKQQAASTKWHHFRTGRITASNAGAVCATSIGKPSQSLLKKICHPENCQFSSQATDWGKKNEPKARAAYVAAVATQHVDFRCSASGLHISPEFPFLAATPDGLIDCACCGAGVLEVKCPFSAKDSCIEQLSQNNASCLIPEGGDARLSRSHHYYAQVQMQMFVCKRNYCDFVVWTVEDMFVERIALDENFCSMMLEKCTLYFQKVLLPELRFGYWSKAAQAAQAQLDAVVMECDTPEEERYCYCEEPEHGDMVQCDGKRCERKWFHFACVGLKRPPKARKWFCKECRQQGSE